MIRRRRPAVAAAGVATLAAAVALPLWTLASASSAQSGAVAPTNLPVLSSSPTAATTSSPIPTDAGSVYLNAPIIKQDLALDCESAALEVALAIQGIHANQDQIYQSLPQDSRPVQLGADGYPVRWGDPYVDFVGDVNGYEPSYTGYGVYYPPVLAAAQRYGATAHGGLGWTVPEIVQQLREGSSVVVWLTSDFKAHPPRYWTAWDGRRVPWAVGEHAVPVIGYDPVANTVTVVDVLYGVERTLPTSAFAAAMTTFGGMAITVAAPA
ncbi:MAG TPA: C39 family peptidase [Candidatus Saccharimonadales bacterium]|nr:C39 family peptidase [Candidatus Saccharimonadales bacterium]